MRIVTKAFLRYLPRRRGLGVLQLMGIACGVSAAVGMALSSQAALSSFSQAVEFLKGKATHSLERPAGPMEETLLADLMRDPAVSSFSPVIDRTLRLKTGETVRLLGIDPFLDRALRPELARVQWEPNQGGNEERLSFLLDEKSVLLDADLAFELKLRPGDRLATNRGDLRLVGTFPNPSSEPLILLDIAQAQRLFLLPGKLDRVDLVLADQSGFRSRWANGFRLQSGKQRQETLSDMLRAFRLNLQALSLLALFVGIFLVYNTAMFAVVSRRKDAGILRSLGASRREIVFAFLTEVLFLGALGGVVGGALGYFLSRFLTTLVAGTISNLYFFLRPVPPDWSGWVLLAGTLMGCGASLLGGFFPLAELVRVDPVQALQGRTVKRGQKKMVRKAALAGVGVLGVGLGLLAVSSAHVYYGFASSFALLIGASLLAGLTLVQLAPTLRRVFGRVAGLSGRVAAGNIRQNLGRTAVAVAAFMVALSMSIGLSSMIGSFRQSLIWWMGTQLQADLYIGKLYEMEVPEDFYEELKSLPGLGGVDPYRNVQVDYRETPIFVSAVDPSVLQKYTNFGWLKGGNENWDPVKKGAVIISESFHRRFGVNPGDRVTLNGSKGPAHLEVAAVFFDYTSEHGMVMMARSTFLDLYGDTTINSLGIFVDPDNPRRQELLEEVRRRAQARGLPVFSRSQLHGNILAVFDSTFAVTRSMQVMTIIVAFFGIAGALLTLFMERQKEFGIYRALGFSTPQVAGMTLLEGLGMGVVSFLLSLGVGTALAWVLIRVINLRSFNWTIFFYPEASPYLMAAAIAVLASIGAAVYPIWKVYRTYPQLQIREE
ncbi:MAG: FtsX-like permease family protein [Syntrophaceae bacterium]|nr:FtsX-like permease family protein [Syntrophaceae bacterium]